MGRGYSARAALTRKYSMTKHYYIYLIQHESGWNYVGKRIARHPLPVDTYWGSGIDVKRLRKEMPVGWSKQCLHHLRLDNPTDEQHALAATELRDKEPYFIEQWFDHPHNLNRIAGLWQRSRVKPVVRALLSEIGKQRVVSQHTKDLISKATKGKKRLVPNKKPPPWSDERRAAHAALAATRKGMSSPNKGGEWTQQQRDKHAATISARNANKRPPPPKQAKSGWKMSEDQKAKISASQKGKARPRTEAHQQKLNAAYASRGVEYGQKIREANARNHKVRAATMSATAARKTQEWIATHTREELEAYAKARPTLPRGKAVIAFLKPI